MTVCVDNTCFLYSLRFFLIFFLIFFLSFFIKPLFFSLAIFLRIWSILLDTLRRGDLTESRLSLLLVSTSEESGEELGAFETKEEIANEASEGAEMVLIRDSLDLCLAFDLRRALDRRVEARDFRFHLEARVPCEAREKVDLGSFDALDSLLFSFERAD